MKYVFSDSVNPDLPTGEEGGPEEVDIHEEDNVDEDDDDDDDDDGDEDDVE